MGNAIHATPAVDLPRVERKKITLTERPTTAMINLRGALDDPTFMKAVTNILGTDLPTRPNRFVETQAMRLLWLGPDEWMILGTPDGETVLCQHLRQALADSHHAVTDVTGNRAVFHLSGASARELLSVGCSMDLDARSFGSGDCAQTLLARTAVTLLQTDEQPSYLILVRRSFAFYLWSWLVQGCHFFGLT